MARIALAWELGANFGHVSRMLPVAQVLRARGHRVELVLRELHRGQAVLRPHGFEPLQAPVWTGKTPTLPRAPTFAGVLQRCGYHAVPALAGLVAGWRRLYELIAPDLVALDHAPTAALAALCLGIPCVRLGSGWFAPPDTTPPAFVEPWRPAGPHAVPLVETRVLGAINAVLKAAGRAPLQRVTQIFRLDADLLTTFPELDHFSGRAGAQYYGPTERPVSATPPDWPAGAGPRLFGFVDAGYAGFAALVQDLAALGLPALLYARELPAPEARRLSTATLAVIATPVDLDRAVGEADLAICHCGHGTICGALLAGKPLLLLPRHSEQRMLADRVAATGAGVTLLATKTRVPDHGAALRQILETPSYAAAARAFAARHADHDVERAAAAIADRCEEVLARRAAGPGAAREAAR